MDRQIIIVIVDALLKFAALLIAFFCAKNVFFALKNKYVFINGKKAMRSEEPWGYWLVILSWLVIVGLFGSFIVSSF